MRSRRPAGGAPGAARSNAAGGDTALLEALWRGDELEAALRVAQARLADRERDLARAEEKIAELSDIADAAQSAVETLRAEAADARQAAERDRELRDSVAAELFRISLRRDAEQKAAARGSPLPASDDNVSTGLRQGFAARWWGFLRRARRSR